MSDLAASSEMECSWKNSRVIRRVVASSLMCLAPFSQYSFMCRLPGSGSGQAQPGQSIPLAWLMFSRLIAVRRGEVCSSENSSACITAGSPVAHCLGGLTFRRSSPVASLAVIGRGLSCSFGTADCWHRPEFGLSEHVGTPMQEPYQVERIRWACLAQQLVRPSGTGPSSPAPTHRHPGSQRILHGHGGDGDQHVHAQQCERVHIGLDSGAAARV